MKISLQYFPIWILAHNGSQEKLFSYKGVVINL